MTKEKISEYDASADGNTDVNGVNIAEGCAPSGINNAIREVMGALKRFETGADGDSITVGGNLVVSGSTTANTIGATVVNASGNATVGGTLVVTGATTFSGNVVVSGSTTATTVSATVVQSDTISEKTSAAGVTVDGVLLKDTTVTANTIKASGTASSQGEIQLFEDTDNGTNYVAIKAPADIASDLTFTLPATDGTSGQALTTNGSGGLSFATIGGAANIQTFDAGDTWTKPASGSMARIQLWGGGGGGSRASGASAAIGGGGGGYNEITLPLSSLGGTETVTIGAGGAGRTGSAGAGTAGGQTSFGSHCTAYGGGAGPINTTQGYAGGGGQLSAGGSISTGSTNNAIAKPAFRLITSAGNAVIVGTMWHGGPSLIENFKDALFGGAGGASAAESAANTTGGTSVYGGAGGDGGRVTSGFDGTAPAGGGGGRNNNANGGNGAAGRVIVTVW